MSWRERGKTALNTADRVAGFIDFGVSIFFWLKMCVYVVILIIAIWAANVLYDFTYGIAEKVDEKVAEVSVQLSEKRDKIVESVEAGTASAIETVEASKQVVIEKAVDLKEKADAAIETHKPGLTELYQEKANQFKARFKGENTDEE